MWLRTIVGGGIALIAAQAWAQSIDINLNNESVRLEYSTWLAAGQHGHSEVDLGVLYNEESNTAVNTGLHVFSRTWRDPFTVGIGGRIYGAQAGDYDGLALALGAQFRYAPPSLNGIGFGGRFYYAPRIVSFMDIESLAETGVRLDYQLLPQAYLYVGYRDVRMKIEDVGTARVDRGGHVGMQILF